MTNFQVKCSENGKCFYDLLNFLSKNSSDVPLHSCICNYGWTDEPGNDVKCCYQRKSQFMAFLLEFLIGFGAGHIYLNNMKLGLVKLASSIALCCTCFTIACCFCYKEDESKEEEEKKQTPTIYRVFNLVMILAFMSYVTWHLIDCILFGLNFYPDSNGIALEPW